MVPTRAQLSAEAHSMYSPLHGVSAKDMEAIVNGTYHAPRTLFARPKNKLVFDDSSTLSPLSRSQRTRNDRHGTAPMAAFTTTTTTTATAATSAATLPLVDSTVPMETEAATRATQNGHNGYDDGHRPHDRVGATAATATNGNRDPLTTTLVATRIGGGGGSTSNNSGSDNINAFIPIRQGDEGTDPLADGRRTRTTGMLGTTTTSTDTANGSSAAAFGTASGAAFAFANNGSTTGLVAQRRDEHDLAQLGRAVATSPLVDWTSVGEPRLVRSPFDDSLLEDRTKLLYSPIPMKVGCTGRRRGMPPDCHSSGFIKTEAGPDGAVLSSSAAINKEEFDGSYDQNSWAVKKEENAAVKSEQDATEERIARRKGRIAAAKKRPDDATSALQQPAEQDCNGGGAMDVEEPSTGSNHGEDGADESSTKPPAVSVLVMSLGARVRARHASSTDMETTTVGSTGEATAAAAVAAPKDAIMENMEGRAASSSSSGPMDARREDGVATNKRARADDDDAPDDSAISTRKSSRFGKEQMVAFDGARKKAPSPGGGACQNEASSASRQKAAPGQSAFHSDSSHSGTTFVAMSTRPDSNSVTVSAAAAAYAGSMANQLMVSTTTTTTVQQSSDDEAASKQKCTASSPLLSSSVDSYNSEEEAALATISNVDFDSPASYPVQNHNNFMDVESNGEEDDNMRDGTCGDVHGSSIAPSQCPKANLTVQEALGAENAALLSKDTLVLPDSQPRRNSSAVAAAIGNTSCAVTGIAAEAQKNATPPPPPTIVSTGTTQPVPSTTTANKASGLSGQRWIWTADVSTSTNGGAIGSHGMSATTTSTMSATVTTSTAGATISDGLGVVPSSTATEAVLPMATTNALSDPAAKPPNVLPLADQVPLTSGKAAAATAIFVTDVQNGSTVESADSRASKTTGLNCNRDGEGDEIVDQSSKAAADKYADVSETELQEQSENESSRNDDDFEAPVDGADDFSVGNETSVENDESPDEEASVENGETLVEDDESSHENEDDAAVSETVTVYQLGGQWKLKVVVLQLGKKVLTQRSFIPPARHRRGLASRLQTFDDFESFLTYLAGGASQELPAGLPGNFLGGGWEFHDIGPKGKSKYILKSSHKRIMSPRALEEYVKASMLSRAGLDPGQYQWRDSADDDTTEPLESVDGDSKAVPFEKVTTYNFEFADAGPTSGKWKFSVFVRQSDRHKSYSFSMPEKYQLQFQPETILHVLYFLTANQGCDVHAPLKSKLWSDIFIGEGWILERINGPNGTFTLTAPHPHNTKSLAIRHPSNFHRYLEALKAPKARK